MCPGNHWRLNDDGGRDRQRTGTSALARILRTPNNYQSISDFLLNATRRLYMTGNAFAVAIRNDRFEIKELHLMLGACSAQVAANGEVFLQPLGQRANRAQAGARDRRAGQGRAPYSSHTPNHPLSARRHCKPRRWTWRRAASSASSRCLLRQPSPALVYPVVR
jgi:hypothetical protein